MIFRTISTGCNNPLFKLIKVSSTAVLKPHYFSSSSSFLLNNNTENDSPTSSLDQLRQQTIKFLERVRDPSKLDTKYIPLKSKKSRGDGYTSKHFKDHTAVVVKGGNGGDGSVSLASVYRNEYAGPDGGDGGNGGHVVFKSTFNRSSLCHIPTTLRAPNGGRGRNRDCNGGDAQHLIVQVPVGTIIRYDGNNVGSLDVENALYVAARGGAGGKGNAFFVTDVDQAPEVSEHGGVGEEFPYEIELRTMADIGLIGFPNAGKSTLLRAISRARPKIAAYPFTTLNPHVGVVHYADMMQLAVADIPGLIENAHLNKGLGYAFLRHVHRCSGLLYVLDASQPEPWTQLTVLRKELEMYDQGLSLRPHAIVANKIDLPHARENLAELEARVDLPVVAISAKHGERVQELLSLIRWLTERNTHRQSQHLGHKQGVWEIPQQQEEST